MSTANKPNEHVEYDSAGYPPKVKFEPAESAQPPIDATRAKDELHTVQCWMCRWWFKEGFTGHWCPRLNNNCSVGKTGTVISPSQDEPAPSASQPLTCEQQAQKSQDYPFEFGPIAQPTQPEPPSELTITIARELYDRFVMGGWGPADAYGQIDTWLAENKIAAQGTTAEQLINRFLVSAKNQGITIEAFDPETEAYERVTGYIYDPQTRTIQLQTDDNS